MSEYNDFNNKENGAQRTDQNGVNGTTNNNTNANMNNDGQYANYSQQPQNNGYQSYGYSNYGYGQQGPNEYSYEPPKKKKKSKKALNAVLAILCVAAIGVSSVVGYSLLTGDGSVLTDDSSSSSTVKQSSEDTATSSTSTRDTSNLPTIEQLSTPDDALSISEIVTKVSPSVVGISCITDDSEVSGTGIILSEDGYIVTNAHVVEDASAISVVITDSTSESAEEETDDSSSKTVAEKILEDQDGDSSESTDDGNITAELVGIDTQTDLAVLKIDKTGLTPAEFGTSSEVVVGEVAIVIGNPLGFDLANTVTSGIISATDRTLTIEDRTMTLIQTDASINSGNSGGPLINAYGQVIGITSAKVSTTYGEGLGFAIPIDDAVTIIDDLIEYGYVTGRPSLGISGENISSFYADYYGVPQGFIVRSVDDGSAAEDAGIEVNDIIVGIQGELIESIEEFNEIKSEYSAGDTITVSVYRNDNIVDIEVTLGEAVSTESSDDDSSSETDDYSDEYDQFREFYNYYYGQEY
ncbi:MAG: trypsin-like peptidase domain-containing protein [Ruminococcus sp.]|nr:trypsin-like peptidase domain-containing protein [Ruminococcus sp.]